MFPWGGGRSSVYIHYQATCCVGAAPALSKAQGVAPPSGSGLAVGKARWRSGRGRVAAPGALWDLPQLVGQRALVVGNGARRPSRFHF